MGTLQAHKVLLSASSTFFQTIFCQQIAPTSNIKPFIYIKGISFNDLSLALDFVYNRAVSVPKHNLQSFLNSAEELKINGLTRGGKETNLGNVFNNKKRGKTRNDES